MNILMKNSVAGTKKIGAMAAYPLKHPVRTLAFAAYFWGATHTLAQAPEPNEKPPTVSEYTQTAQKPIDTLAIVKAVENKRLMVVDKVGNELANARQELDHEKERWDLFISPLGYHISPSHLEDILDGAENLYKKNPDLALEKIREVRKKMQEYTKIAKEIDGKITINPLSLVGLMFLGFGLAQLGISIGKKIRKEENNKH